MKIKEANAVYTGGNIWLFYGQLEDGNYFLTDDNGCTQILNANPGDDFEEACYYEWQQKHLVGELWHEERMNFCNKLLDYIFDNPDHDGGMDEAEINAYRIWFESDNY